MPLTRSPEHSVDGRVDTGASTSDVRFQQILSEQQSVPQISSATVCKIPPFWKGNPQLWFIQVEAVFKVNRITRGDTKFDHILCNLDPATLEFVGDIILAPPSDGCKYEALKRKLINAFAESEEKKLRRLLSGHAIGDQKPTHYLQFMRNSGSGQVSETLLRALFMEQMPENVRAILVGNKGSLDDIAEQADKIFEQLSPSISAISDNSAIAEVLSKIEALERRFEHFHARSPRRGKSSGDANHARRRSKSRVKDWCWYHNTFKDKALKCIVPCSYAKN